MKELINAGLIGTGYWGPNIAKSLELTGKAKVRWLSDINGGLLNAIGKRYPDAKTTPDYNEILNDSSVEAVAIATPVATHSEIAKKALLAGKHVLVEKPMTLSSESCQDLVLTAEKCGKILMVGHVFQYNPGIRELKKIIDANELGKILYLSFERTNLGPVRTGENALWDLASHDISIFCDLLDGPPFEVSATGKSFLNPGIEDVVFSTYRYKNGPVAHVHASWLNPSKVRRLTVVGEKKMALWDDMDLKNPLKIIDKHVETPPPEKMGDTYLDYKTVCVEGPTMIPKFDLNPPLALECEHFLDCIENGLNPRTDGKNGLMVVKVLEAATKSLASNGEFINI